MLKIENPELILEDADVLSSDNSKFEHAHEKGAKEFEWPWLRCNEDAIMLLKKYGYDVKTPILRAIVSIAILSTMRTLKK